MRISSTRSPWWTAAKRILPAVVVATLSVGTTWAQDADQPVAVDHERRIKELEDTIKQLKKDERQLEVNAETQKPLAAWADGFYIASQDGAYKLKIGGYTQFDGRFFVDDSTPNLTNQFLFRRARIDLQGTVAKYFDFRIMPDFAQPNSSSSVVLFDAYVDANFIPQAKLRFGKFKPPVGLERLQGAPYIEFIERAQPTNLVPNRDFGVQLFGELLNGAWTYQAAVVNGIADNTNPTSGDVNDDKDFDGRIFATPFKDASNDLLRNLGLGVALSYGHQQGTTSTPDVPTYKSFGQATYFQYSGANATTKQGPTIASGQRTRYAPQVYYYFGPFGLLGEWVTSQEGLSRDGKVQTISNQAWQVAGSYVITGELASFTGVKPKDPFNPFTNNWGALEATARYGQLVVDSNAFSGGYADPSVSARRDKEWVLGLNWYLNRNVKFTLDYAQSDFRGGAPKGSDRQSEHAIVGQVQLLI